MFRVVGVLVGPPSRSRRSWRFVRYSFEHPFGLVGGVLGEIPRRRSCIPGFSGLGNDNKKATGKQHVDDAGDKTMI